MSIVAWFRGKGASGFGYGSTAEDVTAGLDLSGKSFLLTGCNSGIGKETLRVLGKRGGRVFAAARTVEKAREATAGFDGDLVPIACELSDPRSVRACVETLSKHTLSGIVCNAGIMALPRLELAFGYELQFFTNHVGHFLLVTSLLSQLAPDARIVMVSSAAHTAAPLGGIQFDNLGGREGYSPWEAYGQSKLANILFAKELARRLTSGQSANAIHPGVINTGLARSMPGIARAALAVSSPLFLKSIPQGAATQTYVATHPDMRSTGEYFADCNVAPSSHVSRDPALAARLWEVSERIVAGLPRS
jgi:WW domain-containing oxidoreductase